MTAIDLSKTYNRALLHAHTDLELEYDRLKSEKDKEKDDAHFEKEDDTYWEKIKIGHALAKLNGLDAESPHIDRFLTEAKARMIDREAMEMENLLHADETPF